MLLSEKLLEQARKKAQLAKKSFKHTVNNEQYSLDFYSKGWFYCVTDSQGNWIVNLNTKKASEAKQWLTNWVNN